MHIYNTSGKVDAGAAVVANSVAQHSPSWPRKHNDFLHPSAVITDTCCHA